MLDPDISTADARRLLSQPGHLGDVAGPNGWTRRKFLQAIGGGVLGGAALDAFGSDRFGLGRLGLDMPEAFAATPIGAHDGIVVNIVLYGGNDGLNTVVPYTNGKYYDDPWAGQRQRGDPGRPGAAARRARSACTRASTYTKRVVGRRPAGHRPRRRLSQSRPVALHVDGDLDERPASASAPTGTGWIGRWLDGQPPATADLMAATIGSSVPLHLLGAVRRAVAVPENGRQHVRHRDRSGRRSHVQRPPVVVGERCRTGSRGTTCSPAC